MVRAGYPKKGGGVQNADGIPAGGVYRKFRNAMEISLQEKCLTFYQFFSEHDLRCQRHLPLESLG